MKKVHFEPLPTAVPATKAAPRIPSASNLECNCAARGTIIGVEIDVDQPTKDTFVQFLPEGKSEPCELRIAAFSQVDNVLLAIETSLTGETPVRCNNFVASRQTFPEVSGFKKRSRRNANA